MELKKYLFMVLLVAMSCYSYGQSLSIEAAHNHFSNGIGFLYNHPLGKGWHGSVGPRYLINIFSVNDNIKGNYSYQNGYAATVGEHFGLITKVSKKIYSKGRFRIEGLSNLITTYCSIKYKVYNDRYGPVPTGLPRVDIHQMNPGWSFEFTISPKINYKISNRFELYAITGFGTIIYLHDNEGVGLVSNVRVIQEQYGWTNRKWAYEMVGFEFPTISLGCTYKLKR